MSLFETLQPEAKTFFQDSKGSHDWEHTGRVLALAEHIAKTENADQEIVRIAALLHDIARGEEDRSGGQSDHAQRGAELARDLLLRHHAPEALIRQVCHCIQTHRFRGALRPESLEAKVLFDADKLDSIGAVGIGRAFLFAGEVGAKLHNSHVAIESTQPYTVEDTAWREYQVKLKHIRERILTAEGRRLAQERHEFMVDFFKRLDQEVTGVL